MMRKEKRKKEKEKKRKENVFVPMYELQIGAIRPPYMVLNIFWHDK